MTPRPKFYRVTLGLSCLLLLLPGGQNRAREPLAWTLPADAGYARLLAAYVNAKGRVDYAALKLNRGALDAYIAALGNVTSDQLSQMPETDQIAFWLNAYNAVTLKVIIDHYPIKSRLITGFLYPANSIRQIKGAWDQIKHHIAGRDLTLNAIEHGILRKQYHEPRIHVALVCAARGCPRLRMEPYTGTRLDTQLDDQARTFLADNSKFFIDKARNEVALSSIFKWFGGDFQPIYETLGPITNRANKTEQAVLNFALRYLPESQSRWLAEHGADVRLRYLDYDWTLNDRGEK